MNKQDIESWAANSTRFDWQEDEDKFVRIASQCFQDLAPKWVGVDTIEAGEPYLFYIPLRGYPENMVTGCLMESGVIESIDGEDNGYTMEDVVACHLLPAAPEANDE